MNQLLIPVARRVCNVANKFSPSWVIPGFQRDGWELYLESNKDKQFDRLLIRVPSRPRTTGKHSQNSHLNGHCQQIAHNTGNDFDSVKYSMKYMAISEGYPFDTINKVVVPWSETRIDTKQCGILIDLIHRWAAENGIVLIEDELGIL